MADVASFASAEFPGNPVFAQWVAAASPPQSTDNGRAPGVAPASGGGDSRPAPGTADSLLVFLCHSHGDKPAVRDLDARLRAAGVGTWLDEKDILPGQKWQEAIRKALRRCHAVIVCLSRASVSKAGFVNREIKMALEIVDEQPEGAIFLIPARLDDGPLPDRLGDINRVDLFTPGGFDRLIGALRQRASELDLKLS